MKGVWSFRGWFIGLVFVSVQEIFTLVQPSTNYFFPHRSLFQPICPPSLAGSRAGSPVS